MLRLGNRLLSMTVLAYALSVCGGEQPAEDIKVQPPPPQPKQENDRYNIAIENTDGKVGQESIIRIRVQPKAPWHMNLDFDTSINMEAPQGVSLAKADQNAGDAVHIDANGCEFEVAFTPNEQGEKLFRGRLGFAVCQIDACAPITDQLDFKVTVE